MDKIYIENLELNEMVLNRNAGVCLDCGEIHYDGIEPDAKNNKCNICEALKVMGLENALSLDFITTKKPRILHNMIGKK